MSSSTTDPNPTPTETMRFANISVHEIYNRDVKGKPWTKKTAAGMHLRHMIADGVLEQKWDRPDLMIPELKGRIRSDTGNKNTLSQEVGRVGTFLSRMTSVELGVPAAQQQDIVARYHRAAKDLRGEYEKDRAAGKAGVRDRARDVHLAFPVLEKKAQAVYIDTSPLFYKTSRATMRRNDYNLLMNANIMMVYTKMPHVRSNWVTVKIDRHADKNSENVLVDNHGEMYILWNHRKGTSQLFVQRLPDELYPILQKWIAFNEGHTDGRVFPDWNGTVLTPEALGRRISRYWKKHLKKPIGISDMRRIQISHYETTITDPLARRRLPREFHHSKAEHELYFREVQVPEEDLLSNDADQADIEIQAIANATADSDAEPDGDHMDIDVSDISDTEI